MPLAQVLISERILINRRSLDFFIRHFLDQLDITYTSAGAQQVRDSETVGDCKHAKNGRWTRVCRCVRKKEQMTFL